MSVVIGGYEAEPQEVEALLDGLLDEHDLADPTLMYIEASKQMVLYTAVAERLGLLRAEAVQRLCNTGLSYQQVADHLGLSKPRVQQLVAQATAARP